jgi:hypothetical protein
MMDNSVNDRHGDIAIKKELSPMGKFLICGQDD